MAISKSSVRIIGGEHRGRRLQFTDQNGDLRPTGDRMRETVFNWLQFDIAGRKVLDLFAGSGVLAVEALSRGASFAHLVEKKRPRVDDLKQQLQPLFNERIRIQCADAMQWLEWEGDDSFDLVFVDPPYDTALQSVVCERLYLRNRLAPNALIYVESRAQGLKPVVPHHWQLQKEKVSGEIRAQLYLQPASEGVT